MKAFGFRGKCERHTAPGLHRAESRYFHPCKLRHHMNKDNIDLT